MSDPTIRDDDTWEGPRSEATGAVIGPYTLLRLIGEGGFGDVWEAEQSEPVKRRVALKILKLGMDTREVIARFALERQALAMMEHPHIAQVFDAGATSAGRPYFVMEFVDGVPISDYCASAKLPVDAVLQLFAQVCAAVQHAHTKGVIHRDLKPGNMLVGSHDGAPFAKVIDFGIAKATSSDGDERTSATRMHQVIGTPLYMSPEQAIGSLDIDTRTDVYSLGVILYELLTGTTPVEREKLASVSLEDTQRLIRDFEPPRPSARVLQNATTLTGSATFRPADPHKLARTIRGDLDWIVMKALEKEPARRYQSAADFAEDIRRYLAGEAVSAVPPSLRYRARKFVRRNKMAVIAASLVTVSLLAGIVAFAWQARIAQKRASELAQVVAFESAMFEQIDPALAGQRLSEDVRGKFADALRKSGVPTADQAARLQRFAADWDLVNATDAAREVIDQNVLQPAAASIDAKFGKQPLVAAQLHESLVGRYSEMGMPNAAISQEEKVLAIRRKLLGADADDTLESEYGMGVLLQQQGRFAPAAAHYEKVLAVLHRRGRDDTQGALSVLGNLALVYSDLGRYEQAEPLYLKVIEGRQRLLGKDHPDTLLALQNMGALLREQGKFEQAEGYIRQAAAALDRADPNSESALYAHGNLALLAVARGRLADAEREITDVRERARRSLGEYHPTTLLATILMGSILERRGKHDQAERLLAGIEPAASKTLTGDNAFWYGMLREHLGQARAGLGRFAEAEADLLAAHALLATPHVAQEPNDLRECTQSLIDLYTVWDKAEPGKGYAAKAAQWREKLKTLDTGKASPGK
ncbi:MAG: serine/threonine protein kinase [Proteobacteria bacterium]|nr:serine/threonine protein kinase [Pseudomonadota bacterium]